MCIHLLAYVYEVSLVVRLMRGVAVTGINTKAWSLPSLVALAGWLS